VVGFIHAKDLLAVPPEGRNRPLPPGRIRQLISVAPDTKLEQLLARMRRLRIHLALVRGPGGSPVGLVTLEDLLEELVGEMRDESDREPPTGGAQS
jgi:CBS domain containing-hemolysin-like protein